MNNVQLSEEMTTKPQVTFPSGDEAETGMDEKWEFISQCKPLIFQKLPTFKFFLLLFFFQK